MNSQGLRIKLWMIASAVILGTLAPRAMVAQNTSEQNVPAMQPTPQTVPNTWLQPGSQPIQFERLLGIFPVVEAPYLTDNVAPLSPSQKFQIFTRSTFDPSIVVLAAVGAGLTSNTSTQPQYGGGAAAFGQRTGAIAASYASTNLFAKSLLPIMLHQDPRYFRKGEGSFGSRVLYAATRSVITRTDTGGTTLNTSFLGGEAMAVALDNTYYPNRNRNAADATSRYFLAIGIGSVANVIREFHKKHD